MWKRTVDEHLPDEWLISSLDGELTFWGRWRMRRHLRGCWRCRTRRNEFEQQVRQLSSAYATDLFPSPGRVDEARRRFFAEFYRTPAGDRSTAVETLRRISPRWWAFAAAVVVLIVVGLSVWPRDTLRPEDVMAAALDYEHGLSASTQVVRQSYRVEIVQRRPKPERRVGRIEVWTDVARGRFASRWSGGDGTLRQVSATPPERPLHRISLMQVVETGHDAREIEQAFVRWIGSREWRPVSLASELAVYAGGDGVTLRAERGARVRLTIRKENPDLVAEIVTDFDPRTYEPRRQRMRLESATRSIEFLLVADATESLPAALVNAAVFEPSAPAVPPPASVTIPAAPRTPVTLAPDDAELANTEIAALHALHLLGVCRGEQVDVVRGASSLRVTGVVTDAARKRQVLAALQPLTGHPWLALDIQTVADAVATEVATAPAYSAELTARAENRLPVHDELAAYLSVLSGDAGVEERIQQFAAAATGNWDAVRREAFSLRRLAERYSGATRLSPENERLLGEMIRDHLRELNRRTVAARNQIEPFLESLDLPATPATVPALPSSARWQQQVSLLFQGVMLCHGNVRALFTADPTTEPQSVEEAIAVLSKDLARLTSESDRLNQAAAGDLLTNLPANRRHPSIDREPSGSTP